MFKKIIILFFIGTMFLSSYVYADEYKLHTVNFSIEGGENLTEDIELILYYDDDTCTSILLENEKNYNVSTKLRDGKVKVKISNLTEIENVNVEYDKEININKDMDYIVTSTAIGRKEKTRMIGYLCHCPNWELIRQRYPIKTMPMAHRVVLSFTLMSQSHFLYFLFKLKNRK